MAADTPTSLGEFLRQEREKRGITIEQVASATKVSVRMLHALEADHYVELPAKPFIRGFVTSYARFIGLDPKEILTQYGHFIDDRSHDRPSREGGHSGYAFEKREGEQSRTVLWIIMSVSVVLGVIFIIFFKPARHHRGSHADKLREAHGTPTPSAHPSAQVSPSPVGAPVAVAVPSPSPGPAKPAAKPSPSPAPTKTQAPAPSPTASPSPTTEDKLDPLNSGVNLKPNEIKQRVLFKALADIWVRYKVDDRPVMKFAIKKDRVLVLRAREVIRFQVSNPNSVLVNANSRGYKLAAAETNLATRQGTATLIYPPQLSEANQEPFPGERPLPQTPPPAASGSASPTGEAGTGATP